MKNIFYDGMIWLPANFNIIATMNTAKQKLKIIRKVDCRELNFIGISKKLIFVEAVFENGKSYVCIDKKGKKHAVDFRLENEGELVKPVMEDGFLYYYKKEGNEYNLYRQKFGSEKIVTLVKNVSPSAYAAVENNRLFYCEMSSGRYRLKELNMNNKNHKLLFSVKADSPEYMSFCHGGTYDFIYGKRSENGERVYASSCILTSSSRVMYFKDAHWKY
ncbi:MAG: hypothetical protein IJT65_01750 [Eubacterium sp.]|nr:hypothetical protein [Eubacterium sp.]